MMSLKNVSSAIMGLASITSSLAMAEFVPFGQNRQFDQYRFTQTGLQRSYVSSSRSFQCRGVSEDNNRRFVTGVAMRDEIYPGTEFNVNVRARRMGASGTNYFESGGINIYIGRGSWMTIRREVEGGVQQYLSALILNGREVQRATSPVFGVGERGQLKVIYKNNGDFEVIAAVNGRNLIDSTFITHDIVERATLEFSCGLSPSGVDIEFSDFEQNIVY